MVDCCTKTSMVLLEQHHAHSVASCYTTQTSASTLSECSSKAIPSQPSTSGILGVVAQFSQWNTSAKRIQRCYRHHQKWRDSVLEGALRVWYDKEKKEAHNSGGNPSREGFELLWQVLKDTSKKLSREGKQLMLHFLWMQHKKLFKEEWNTWRKEHKSNEKNKTAAPRMRVDKYSLFLIPIQSRGQWKDRCDRLLSAEEHAETVIGSPLRNKGPPSIKSDNFELQTVKSTTSSEHSGWDGTPGSSPRGSQCQHSNNLSGFSIPPPVSLGRATLSDDILTMIDSYFKPPSSTTSSQSDLQLENLFHTEIPSALLSVGAVAQPQHHQLPGKTSEVESGTLATKGEVCSGSVGVLPLLSQSNGSTAATGQSQGKAQASQEGGDGLVSSSGIKLQGNCAMQRASRRSSVSPSSAPALSESSTTCVDAVMALHDQCSPIPSHSAPNSQIQELQKALSQTQQEMEQERKFWGKQLDEQNKMVTQLVQQLQQVCSSNKQEAPPPQPRTDGVEKKPALEEKVEALQSQLAALARASTYKDDTIANLQKSLQVKEHAASPTMQTTQTLPSGVYSSCVITTPITDNGNSQGNHPSSESLVLADNGGSNGIWIEAHNALPSKHVNQTSTSLADTVTTGTGITVVHNNTTAINSTSSASTMSNSSSSCSVRDLEQNSTTNTHDSLTDQAGFSLVPVENTTNLPMTPSPALLTTSSSVPESVELVCLSNHTGQQQENNLQVAENSVIEEGENPQKKIVETLTQLNLTPESLVVLIKEFSEALNCLNGNGNNHEQPATAQPVQVKLLTAGKGCDQTTPTLRRQLLHPVTPPLPGEGEQGRSGHLSAVSFPDSTTSNSASLMADLKKDFEAAQQQKLELLAAVQQLQQEKSEAEQKLQQLSTEKQGPSNIHDLYEALARAYNNLLDERNHTKQLHKELSSMKQTLVVEESSQTTSTTPENTQAPLHPNYWDEASTWSKEHSLNSIHPPPTSPCVRVPQLQPSKVPPSSVHNPPGTHEHSKDTLNVSNITSSTLDDNTSPMSQDSASPADYLAQYSSKTNTGCSPTPGGTGSGGSNGACPTENKEQEYRLKECNQKLQAQLHKTSRLAKQREKTVTELTAEKTQLVGYMQTLETKLHEMQSAQQQKLKEWEDEMEKAVGDRQQQIQCLKHEVEEASKRISTTAQQTNLQNINATISLLQSELEDKQFEVQRLQSTVTEVQTEKRQLEALFESMQLQWEAQQMFYPTNPPISGSETPKPLPSNNGGDRSVQLGNRLTGDIPINISTGAPPGSPLLHGSPSRSAMKKLVASPDDKLYRVRPPQSVGGCSNSSSVFLSTSSSSTTTCSSSTDSSDDMSPTSAPEPENNQTGYAYTQRKVDFSPPASTSKADNMIYQITPDGKVVPQSSTGLVSDFDNRQQDTLSCVHNNINDATQQNSCYARRAKVMSASATTASYHHNIYSEVLGNNNNGGVHMGGNNGLLNMQQQQQQQAAYGYHAHQTTTQQNQQQNANNNSASNSLPELKTAMLCKGGGPQITNTIQSGSGVGTMVITNPRTASSTGPYGQTTADAPHQDTLHSPTITQQQQAVARNPSPSRTPLPTNASCAHAYGGGLANNREFYHHHHSQHQYYHKYPPAATHAANFAPSSPPHSYPPPRSRSPSLSPRSSPELPILPPSPATYNNTNNAAAFELPSPHTFSSPSLSPSSVGNMPQSPPKCVVRHTPHIYSSNLPPAVGCGSNVGVRDVISQAPIRPPLHIPLHNIRHHSPNYNTNHSPNLRSKSPPREWLKTQEKQLVMKQHRLQDMQSKMDSLQKKLHLVEVPTRKDSALVDRNTRSWV